MTSTFTGLTADKIGRLVCALCWGGWLAQWLPFAGLGKGKYTSVNIANSRGSVVGSNCTCTPTVVQIIIIINEKKEKY